MDLAFTHGWSGLVFSYASAQIPMIVGLVRSRAAYRHYVASPLVAASMVAVTGIGMTAAAPLLNALGAAPYGLIRLALGTAAIAAFGYGSGRGVKEGDADQKHQRGTMLDERAASATSRQTREPRENGTASRGRDVKDRGITLAGSAISPSDETKHFKLVGTTGTGKSTAITEILSAALARGDRAVIADPDGGYMRRFYDPGRGDIVLNPFDKGSRKWDLFAEIESPYDVDQLARSLIPDHEGSERSWRGYARTFFSAVTRQAHADGVNDMGELYRLLVVADAKELRTLVQGTPAQPFLDDHNSRMFDSIRSVTSSAVASMDYIAQQTTPQFSIRQWVNQESPGVLFMPYKAGQIAALGSTISGWMRLAIFEAMNQDEQLDDRESEPPRRLWFVVDELDALGQIDGLKDALARLRKFGGRCVLGFQSIAQVSSTYGQGDAHTIVENCGNTLILRCSASEGGGTARFASQLIGEREVVRTTVSRSRRYSEVFGSISHSEHIAVEPAVLASQIEQLPDLAGYLKRASEPQWHRVRLDAVRRWQDPHPGRAASGRSGGNVVDSARVTPGHEVATVEHRDAGLG